MKPFDLDAAKRGEPIVCRDGTPVKFIAYVPEAHDPEKIVVHSSMHGVSTRHPEGCRYRSTASEFDLFMAPIKRTVWVNLYPGSGSTYYHDTQEVADERAGRDRIGGKAWPLEIEE